MSAERPARLAIVDALNFLLNGDESENEFGSDEEESDDDFADVNDDDDNVADVSDDDECNTEAPLEANTNETVVTKDASDESKEAQSAKSRKKQSITKEYRWMKKDVPTKDVNFIGEEAEPPADRYIKTPLEYFKMFISDDMIQLIVDHSNLYSVQKKANSVATTSKEIEQVIGIFFQMGLVSMPGIRPYWESETRYHPIANIMSRNRFQLLLTVLHFVDNLSVSDETKKSDKLWKIRPWLDKLRQNCLQVIPEEKNSVDEMMVPFKGTFSGIKQYMRGKPHPWGFKIWCRTGASGMLYDFDVYQGSNPANKKNTEFGLAADVVIKLCSTLPKQKNYKVYADNYFTGLPLVKHLQNEGIHYVGTIRNNRLPNCNLLDEKSLKEKGRGAFDWRVEQNAELTAVRWYDTRAVTLLSSYLGPHPLDKVRRWSKSSREFVEIDRPKIVSEYNCFMGGVDLLDSFLAKYRYHMKSKRWYLYIFWYTIKIGLINAWLLYRKESQLLGISRKEILNHRRFQANVSVSLMKVNTSASRSAGRPPSNTKSQALPKPPKHLSFQPTVDVRIDQIAHWPVKCPKRGRCKVCKENQTDTKCEKCDVRLCFNEKRNCFKDFHI